jgi:amidase
MIDPYRVFMPYPQVPVPQGEGRLNGLRFAVKDIFDVAGYPTSCGNPIKLAESGIKTTSATAVTQLLAAGACFAGKVQTDELAWSLIGRNPHFGPVINPAAPDRVTGGSSSGSAAVVAAGLADIALGSDTGGSVRGPASFCGVWGLRPTWGRASLEGCMPLVPSFDTCGLFAKHGATLLKAAEVLMGADTGVLSDKPLLARDMFEAITPAARAALLPLGLGMSEGDVDLLVAPPQDMHDCFDKIQSREVVATHGDWIARAQPPLGPFIADRYARALIVTADEERDWRQRRVEMTTALVERLAGRAAVAPVVHDAPIRADAGVAAQLAFAGEARKTLCVAAVAGLPQVVFPAARLDGAPIGLSLIGPPGTDLALIGLAVRLTKGELT